MRRMILFDPSSLSSYVIYKLVRRVYLPPVANNKVREPPKQFPVSYIHIFRLPRH